MMLKAISILKQSLGFSTVAGSKSPRFLVSLYPRLAVGLLALVSVALITLTSSIAHAQDLDKGLQAYNAGDFRTALKEFRPLAESGNAEAQFYLGRAYENGDGVLPNPETAVEWYARAAIQDHTQAQFSLGQAYENGEGVPRSLTLAHVWYNIAGISGDRDARQARDDVQNRLSSGALANARNQAQQCLDSTYTDCPSADPTLASNQAEVVERGKQAYDDKDYTTALRELQPAAEAGHAEAQRLLGWMYVNGLGVAKNYATSIEWFRRSAVQGNALAQTSLGARYSFGEGVARNKQTAYVWYTIAGVNGDKQAPENLWFVGENLSSSQIAEAKRIAQQCMASNYNVTVCPGLR